MRPATPAPERYPAKSDRPTDLPELEDFAFRTFDKIRYRDTDRQGHVNNAVFSTFMETGRTEFLYDPANPLVDAGASFVIARLDISFIGEVHWPGQVEIGTGISRVGSSSVQMRQAVFQNGRCVATAITVIVQVDDESRRSRPLSDEARAFLMSHEQPGS